MLTVILLGVMFFLMIINVPIAVALGVASVVGVLLMGDISLVVIAQKVFTSNDSFPLLAVPFFMLAGELMTYGGVSKRLVDFASSLVGHFRGGLGSIAIIASAFFAALSGSNAATVAAIGSIMIPSMKSKGYNEGYTAATLAAAGTTGMVIPPSILMILYGVVVNVPITDLFIAGLMPGILMAGSMVLLNWFLCRKSNYALEPRSDLQGVWRSFRNASWALFTPVIILGSIYGGVATPTEAAAIASLYGLVIGFFVYKELKLKDLPVIVLRSALATAIVMFVMSTAGLLAWVITINEIPQQLAETFSSISQNPAVYLALVNVLLLFTGCLINGVAQIPFLLPSCIRRRPNWV
jgi:tripartite ATP-independent transporter DctM subunit